ncbi:MAG: CBS domain-containing protein [Candidatus Lokiarchaeota archaeon]|nr:CBS domain-containing protein [Candidatus Lokiarchaeota archaeon]MBD3199546.1 CBS domain-containing protein [Candidatus Lokiarchaeota archaeon]
MTQKEPTLDSFGKIKVSELMIEDPLFITPNEKISTTELLMLRKNIGGLPVVDSKEKMKLLGIITQRDIRLARFAMSLESPNTLVKDLMTPEPYVARRGDTIKKILNLMFDNNIERLPIVDTDNKLIGLVLEKDILKKLMEYLSDI